MRRLRAEQHGFTLVELLVVVLIIGILAAIGVATLLNQRQKAQDAEATVAATTAAKAITAYATEHDGSYAGATPERLARIEPSLSRARGLAVQATAETFTVTVASAAGYGATFSVRHSAAGNVRECSRPGTGSCRAEADEFGNRW